jgi:hypothetical protein
VTAGRELERPSSPATLAGTWFVLLRSREAALFEAAERDEDGGWRNRFTGRLL